MNKNLRSTVDLDTILEIKTELLIEVKNLLDKNFIFNKFFPIPLSLDKNSKPVMCVSSKDLPEVEKTLNKKYQYSIKKLKNNIIEEFYK